MVLGGRAPGAGRGRALRDGDAGRPAAVDAGRVVKGWWVLDACRNNQPAGAVDAADGGELERERGQPWRGSGARPTRDRSARSTTSAGCTNATNVAARRNAGNRATAVTLAFSAKRARAAIRVGAIAAAAGTVMLRLRTTFSRSSARTNAGPLTIAAPVRSVTSDELRPSSGTRNRSSRRRCCGGLMPLASTPHAHVDAVPQLGHEALQRRRARQQHLVGEHPGRRPIEQCARTFGARPALCVEPSREAKPGRAIREVAIPMFRPDLCGMSGSATCRLDSRSSPWSYRCQVAGSSWRRAWASGPVDGRERHPRLYLVLKHIYANILPMTKSQELLIKQSEKREERSGRGR